ncbi:fibronectin type III domain-containing protein [Geobacter sp. DSM 9736]|uniref:fibronectin type III domain-containing protein n=1 Tax=Geobacter sp. DSM 9736 TaxID=1277350 RepID=UPI000B616B86|nr:fibronectin type III domain-containing protein [Geobacter sp. DSM 9736]SNB47720.1 delta-60 repeat domain-containing protein [Geobacter sp. DSM 9736]
MLKSNPFKGEGSMGTVRGNAISGELQGRRRACRTFLGLFLGMTLLLGLQVQAHAVGGDVVWLTSDSQPGKQEPKLSATDSQGNVVLTGHQNMTGGINDDMYTVKFKADGSGISWRALVDRTGGEDRGLAVTVDGNDDVIVTGYVWNGVNRDIHTMKYNGSTGAVIWQHTVNGSANGSDIGTAVTTDSLNNVYVAANSQNSSGNDDILVLKYAPGGPSGDSPLWTVSYNGAADGLDQVNAIAAGVAGVVVTGKSWNAASYDMVTISYGFDGVKVWEKRYSTGGGSNNGCIGNQARFDGSGNVIAVGSVANGSNLDIYVVKYSAANGSVMWQKTYDGGLDEEPLGLAVDAAGDVYVTGYTYTLTGANDFFSARYAGATGTTVWQQLYDSGNGNTDMAVATGIVVDPAGDVFVTGYTVTDGNYDVRTIKYKRDTGNLLWQKAYNAPANKNDRPVGIGISPSGDVLVAGWSDSMANDLDFIILKYDRGVLNPATGLTATAVSPTSIALAWYDNSSTEDGFKIERKLGETGSWSQITVASANATSFTDTGLSPDNTYYYRVRSYNAASGDSSYSNEAHALTVFVTFTAPAWSFSYNNPDNTDDYANAIAVGADNNPIVTGYSNRNTGTFDYFTAKLNRGDRSIIWSDQYDDPDSEMDEAKCLAVDSNGNVIVSGVSQLFYPPAQRNINSIYTIKYPAAGPPETWHGQYNGPGAIDDRATAIATTADGANNVVIIGYGKNASNNDDVYVIKYPANPGFDVQGGAIPAWAATPFDGGGDDIPSAVAVAPDGSVYVTGISEKTPDSDTYFWFTAKYDGSTGALVWADRYSVVAGGANRGASIAVDADGDVYVTGSATTATLSRDIYTIKYSGSSPTARRIWERAIDGVAGGDDAGADVGIDRIDGAILVAGTTLTASGDRDITVVRYSSGGDTLWRRTLLRDDLDDAAVAMKVDSSGYIYIAGTTAAGAGSDMISVIYDYEGNLLGATSYNGPANDIDEASSITVNYKGEAFVAGYSRNASGNADYSVIKQVNNYLLVPAPFTASAQADSSKIGLSWGDNTSGASYLLERTTGPVTDLSIWTQIAMPAAGTTMFQDSGLVANSPYCYRITAISGSFSSRKLISCATTTPVAPVLGPLSLVSATAVDVTWSNVAGNTGYKLERSPDNNSWTQIGGNLAANTTIYNDTGLAAGAVRYYRVSALSNSGASLTSTVQIAPVLNAPGGVTAAKIDLSWPAVSGITGYILERSTDNLNWTQIATPAVGTTAYSNTGLNPATTYYYRLKVTSAAGTSTPSLVQSATTVLVAPTVSLAAGTTTTQINLSWTDVAGEDSYTVWEMACTQNMSSSDISYCVSSYTYNWGAAVQVGTTGQGVTSFSRSGLIPGYSYQYYVVARTAGGITSPASNAVLGWTVPAAPILNVPTAPSDTSVNLTWNDVAGENGYVIERKVGAGAWSTLTTLTQGKTSHTDTTTPQTLYSYRIRAKGAVNGVYSDYSAEQPITTPPTGPVISSVTATSSTTATWGAVSGATSYEVRRSVFTNYDRPDRAGDPYYASYWSAWTTVTTSATGTSYPDPGVSAGYTYKYSVRANISGNYTGWGSDGGKFATTIPAIPSNFRATGNSATQITMNWSNVYGETNYSIRYKARSAADCASESWATGVSTTPAVAMNLTSYQIGSLNTNSAYCFQIRAYNSGTSDWSAATTYLPPPTLSALSGITQSSLTLSWSAVPGNTDYRVERSTDGVTFNLLTIKAAGSTGHTDTGLTAGQVYYYRVFTVNGSNISAPSAVQSAATLVPSAPLLNAPTGATTSQLSLSWNDVSGNYGYKLERSIDNATWTVIANPVQGATSYTNTGLNSGTIYYFRISTKTASGSYSSLSNVQSAMTLLSAPVLALTGSTAATIEMKWQFVYGATNYRVLRSEGSNGPWNEVNNIAAAYAASYCGSPIPTVGCQAQAPNTTFFTDQGLTENLTYCYQLKAWNSTVGNSDASSTVCLKTQSVGGPVLTSASASNSKMIRLDWSYDPGSCIPVACDAPEGFEIWKQLWNGDWTLLDRVGNVSTYTDTLVEPATTYRYKVRAFKATDISSYSNVRSALTPVYNSSDSACP